jgi:glutamate N-acetyltransferase/amino-acid N-acetyltransferase
MAVTIPRGYLLTGVHCGLKQDAQKPDLALIMSEEPAVAAGVYTQNLVHAAPVALDRSRTPSRSIRAVVINSGNANACTGEQGMKDAREMARMAGAVCLGTEEETLVLSTGIIGEYLPMDKIMQGIQSAAVKLAKNETALQLAARAMMTTDTTEKIAGRTLDLAEGTVQLTGLAKGAGMIGPRMATMLGVILTDAPLTAELAQPMLQHAVDGSFNCISVEGHTSTNDTVLLLANGTAMPGPLSEADQEAVQAALNDLCIELAQAIPADGEGATHLITIDVAGCRTRADAVQIARTVADSPLVKTAIAGADPNWGRIVSAAGYAGVPLDPAGMSLRINGSVLFEKGAPAAFDPAAVSASIRENRETHVALTLTEGDAQARFWTSDLTAEYVRINADYHT